MRRNKVASACVFISGMLFILSGYQANDKFYEAAQQDIKTLATKEFSDIAVIPFSVLAIIAHLGGNRGDYWRFTVYEEELHRAEFL